MNLNSFDDSLTSLDLYLELFFRSVDVKLEASQIYGGSVEREGKTDTFFDLWFLTPGDFFHNQPVAEKVNKLFTTTPVFMSRNTKRFFPSFGCHSRTDLFQNVMEGTSPYLRPKFRRM